jgi:hypothetical protein
VPKLAFSRKKGDLVRFYCSSMPAVGLILIASFPGDLRYGLILRMSKIGLLVLFVDSSQQRRGDALASTFAGQRNWRAVEFSRGDQSRPIWGAGFGACAQRLFRRSPQQVRTVDRLWEKRSKLVRISRHLTADILIKL